MQSRWYGFLVLGIFLTANLALAAAYPEMTWFEEDLEPIDYSFELDFKVTPELFRASAVKGSCVLGSRIDCALQ